MNNLLEKILVLETLEKIFRVQSFLSKASITATEPDLKVIGIYNAAINEILKSLKTVFYKLHDKYGGLDALERYSCMRRISDVFNSIDDLHSQLSFIHGEWTTPETYIFIKSLFEKIPECRTDVSIVLSDSYMFEEVDLSSYLESRLNHYNIPAELDIIRPTLFLPKIEYSNPLNWSILVHEIGHVLKKPLEEIFSVDTISQISTTAAGIKMLESWTEEVWCDLIAAKLLGPSYLASYIIFSLVLASSSKINESTDSHPADRFRINIMKAFFDKNDIKLEINCDYTEFKNVTDFFYDLFEERCDFDRNSYYYDKTVYSKFPVKYHELRKLLIEKINVLSHEKIPHMQINNNKIQSLKERLSRGILIGSSCEHQNVSISLTHLNELNSLIVNSEELSQKNKIDGLIKKVLEAVRENPNKIGEIINSGWKYKCEDFYPLMFKNFFTKDDDFDSSYKSFGYEIISLDDKLKKSIEISYIHDLFKEEIPSDS
jgi:hypothetical protein